MTRLALLGVVVLVGCAAKREAPTSTAPAGATPTAAEQDTTGAAAPVAPTTATPPPPPPAEPVNAKEAARASGHLGPTDKDLFTPLPGEGGGDTRERKPKGTGGAPTATLKAGGGGTRGGKVAERGGAATTSLGIPVLSNQADATAVRAALAKHAADIDKCYEAARVKKPKLAGQFTLVFTAQPDGRLDAVSATKSTVKDANLENCVVNLVKTTKLDTPLGPTAVKGSVGVTFRIYEP